MNSRIKRSLSLLLIAAAVLLLPLSCAADSTVSFDEFGFSVTFPADVIVFTRDTEPESPHWEEIGLDRDLFLTLMESSDMYADAISRIWPMRSPRSSGAARTMKACII